VKYLKHDIFITHFYQVAQQKHFRNQSAFGKITDKEYSGNSEAKAGFFCTIH